jgi:uncharacterized membrane protein
MQSLQHTQEPDTRSTLWGKRITVAMAVIWRVIFWRLVLQQHSRFGTFNFDLGIYDQSIWLLSRGHDPFITIRGLNQWGHHANFMLYVLVPFFWFGAGPNFLNMVMILSTAACVWPIHKTAVHYLGHQFYGTLFAALFLWNPTTQFLMWETFHPDVMAMLPLFWAWWFMTQRNWRSFTIACFIAVLWKEDVALAIVVVGFFIAAFCKGDRKYGWYTAVVAFIWFQFINKIFMGHFNDSDPFYNSWFGSLGTSVPEVAINLIKHPTLISDALQEKHAAIYSWNMLTPWGWLPLIAPFVLLIGVPQFLVNIFAEATFLRDYRFHYAAIVLFALTISTMVAIRTLGTSRGRRILLVGFLAICGIRTGHEWGVGPMTKNYKSGFWLAGNSVKKIAYHEALDLIPKNAGVSSSYHIGSHLTHRDYIYDWPNPFQLANWGAANENPPNPLSVDFLILEPENLGESQVVFDDLIANDIFEVIFEREGVMVAQRIKP